MDKNYGSSGYIPAGLSWDEAKMAAEQAKGFIGTMQANTLQASATPQGALDYVDQTVCEAMAIVCDALRDAESLYGRLFGETKESDAWRVRGGENAAQNPEGGKLYKVHSHAEEVRNYAHAVRAIIADVAARL